MIYLNVFLIIFYLAQDNMLPEDLGTISNDKYNYSDFFDDMLNFSSESDTCCCDKMNVSDTENDNSILYVNKTVNKNNDLLESRDGTKSPCNVIDIPLLNNKSIDDFQWPDYLEMDKCIENGKEFKLNISKDTKTKGQVSLFVKKELDIKKVKLSLKKIKLFRSNAYCCKCNILDDVNHMFKVKGTDKMICFVCSLKYDHSDICDWERFDANVPKLFCEKCQNYKSASRFENKRSKPKLNSMYKTNYDKSLCTYCRLLAKHNNISKHYIV